MKGPIDCLRLIEVTSQGSNQEIRKTQRLSRCKINMEFWEGEVYFPIQKYIHMFVSHVDQKKMLGVSIILIFLPCFRILMI